MTLTAPDLERKIDALTEQVALLAAEAEERRQRRRTWDDLRLDAGPLLGQAVATAGRELDGVDVSGEDLIRLVKRLLRNAQRFEAALDGFESALDLVDDVSAMGGEAFLSALRGLDSLERRGYFSFARAGFGVVDEVVTAFTEEDVAALGQNVVTILDTIKEITQPDMLVLLQRTIEALQRQQLAIEEEPEDPPTMFALLRKVRDPDVRRGINRALATLGAVSAETGPDAMKQIHNHNTKRGDG